MCTNVYYLIYFIISLDTVVQKLMIHEEVFPLWTIRDYPNYSETINNETVNLIFWNDTGQIIQHIKRSMVVLRFSTDTLGFVVDN